MRIILILVSILFFAYGENNESRKDVLYTNLIGAAVITAWGAANWEYGTREPHSDSEGWFGHDTKSGGSDKIGHLYASYAIGSGLSILYENWGYSQKEAGYYGALSSFFLMSYMEIGDSFSSELGFSYEDFIMNTAGALSSYFLYTNPELSKRIDLRIEYIPSFNGTDVITQYEKMKYLIAFKAEGFDSISNPYLKYGELHLGYYTRNYTEGFSEQSERIIYLGVGFNLSKLTREYGYTKPRVF